MTSRYVIPGPAAVDPDRVGGKFARQAVMRAAGLPVPPFVSVSADAWTDALAGLRDRIAAELAAAGGDADELRERSAVVRDLVLEHGVPDAVLTELLTAFDATFGPDALVSVRSSSIGADGQGGEDSATDAFAGMADSVLFVPRSGVAAALARVWASAFNAESLLYRRVQGQDPLDSRMAVGVQQMIDGKRSFVLFTRDPRSGADETVVAAGHGIGEGVVQEQVPLDHYFVGRSSGDRPAVRAQVAPEHDAPVLTDDELGGLAALGRQVADLLGGPQDIEGTIDAEGRVHLLQARPIVMDLDLRLLWSSANVTESFPGVTTTLTYTFAQRFYRTIFRDLYRRLGVDPVTLTADERHLDRMIGSLHGRVHYRLGDWYALHRRLTLFPLFRRSWQEMMGIEEDLEERPDRLRDLARTRPGVALRLTGPVARMLATLARHERDCAEFERWWAGRMAEYRDVDWSERDPLARVTAFEELWAEVSVRWGITLINDTVLGAATRIVTALVGRWIPEADPGLVSDLLCGDDDNTSVRAVLSLVGLAEQARAMPALAAALRAEDPGVVWAAVARGEYGERFHTAARTHIREYGNRSPQELRLDRPSLRREPAQLMRMVADQIDGDRTAADLVATEAAARARAEEVLEAALGARSPRTRVLRTLLTRLRRAIRFRENSRYCRSELFGVTKEICHTLGADLAAAGVLRDTGDVHHLTLAEVFGHVEGTAPGGDLQVIADARRAAHDRDVARPDLPIAFSTLGSVAGGLPAPVTPVAPGDGVLTGLGSSSGRVRGRAVVVTDPQQVREHPADMILVARETDPGWLFLMLAARGLVVERGSMLSHTAITGRKFGIPTVVGVAGATTLIPDGALIEMDGATGEVVVLEPPAGEPPAGEPPAGEEPATGKPEEVPA